MTEGKSEGAFRTIGELSAELGVPQHILRYWESRFPQLRPLTRAGNRRYYRPEDVALARRIHHALTHDGFTIKGVQKLLGEAPAESRSSKATPQRQREPVTIEPMAAEPMAIPADPVMLDRVSPNPIAPDVVESLLRIRDELAAALKE